MAAQKITSSAVIATALGISPEGAPAKQPGACAMCGLDIEAGSLHSPFAVGQNFTDDLYLANRGSQIICGYCGPLTSASGLISSGFGAFGSDGVKPFRKWVDVAAAILEPPQPPFVMVYATANNQHMAWRAPVNFSREAFRVRVGLRDLLIRRNTVLEAVEACRILGTAPAIYKPGAANRKTLPNPYTYLSSDLKEPDHARLNPKLLSAEFRATASAQELEALDFVRKLTLGETWALRFVLTPNAGQSTPTNEE